MLTRRQFLALYKAVTLSIEEGCPLVSSEEADFYGHFTRPYVCVVHEPTGNGYYLDRSYRLLVSVASILRPGSEVDRYPLLMRYIPHETDNGFRPGCFKEPDWATSKQCAEFTTYWLY